MAREGYARPELLAETDWLANHLGDQDICIVDCETPDAYGRAHIPNAVNIGTNTYIKGTDRLHVMPSDEVATFMGALGISDDTLVVAYDNRNSLLAARFWWVLNYYGHTNAKVLNGGWHKWMTEERPMTDRLTTRLATNFTPNLDHSLIVSADDLKQQIGSQNVAIWDVRSEAEYTGANARGNKYSGHVPSCTFMEWTDVMDLETGAFRPQEEIQLRLEKIGVTRDKQIYTY